MQKTLDSGCLVNIYSFAGLRNSRRSRTDDLMSADERPVIRRLLTCHSSAGKPFPASGRAKLSFFLILNGNEVLKNRDNALLYNEINRKMPEMRAFFSAGLPSGRKQAILRVKGKQSVSMRFPHGSKRGSLATSVKKAF